MLGLVPGVGGNPQQRRRSSSRETAGKRQLRGGPKITPSSAMPLFGEKVKCQLVDNEQ